MTNAPGASAPFARRAATAPLLRRLEFAPLAALVVGLLVLLLLGWWLTGTSSSDLNRSSSAMREAQSAASDHAAAMRGLVRRLSAGAGPSGTPSAAAQQLIDGAARLDNLALLLGNQAALLGPHPGQSVRTDVTFVHHTGDAVVAEAEAVIAHGQAMRDQAAVIGGLARSESSATADDALLLEEGATQLIDAGERARRAGVLLQQSGSQFMRSLGR